jgi:hypothetical protein
MLQGNLASKRKTGAEDSQGHTSICDHIDIKQPAVLSKYVTNIERVYFCDKSFESTRNTKANKKLENRNFLKFALLYPCWVLASDPEVRVRFPVLPDFLSSSRSGTGSTQPL